MIETLKRFLTGERTSSIKNSRDSGDDIRIAAGVLLLEIANADGKFNESEKENITAYLKINFNLSGQDLDNLIEKSKKEADDSIDIWRFTSAINRNYSIGDKINIIETIWKIAYADGILDKHEDYLVHKLAGLLRLSHKQLIAAKLKVLNEISSDINRPE